MTQEDTDANLVIRARADDPQAFRLLLERYQSMAFYLALRIVQEEETARDLVQEAFLQAYLSLNHLHDTQRFKSWLYGIVLNGCRNWQRKHPHHVLSLDTQLTQAELPFPTTLSIDPIDPVAIVEEREQQLLIREALTSLTPSTQAVTYLFYYEDQSLQEIAQTLHLSLPTVKNRLTSARQQLQTLVQARFPELAHSRTNKRKKNMRFHRLTFINLFHRRPLPLQYFALLSANSASGPPGPGATHSYPTRRPPPRKQPPRQSLLW